MRDEIRSLAEVGLDRTVAVRRILFECVGDRCGELARFVEEGWSEDG